MGYPVGQQSTTAATVQGHPDGIPIPVDLASDGAGLATEVTLDRLADRADLLAENETLGLGLLAVQGAVEDVLAALVAQPIVRAAGQDAFFDASLVTSSDWAGGTIAGGAGTINLIGVTAPAGAAVRIRRIIIGVTGLGGSVGIAVRRKADTTLANGTLLTNATRLGQDFAVSTVAVRTGFDTPGGGWDAAQSVHVLQAGGNSLVLTPTDNDLHHWFVSAGDAIGIHTTTASTGGTFHVTIEWDV
jgi:hypothetical protein